MKTEILLNKEMNDFVTTMKAIEGAISSKMVFETLSLEMVLIEDCCEIIELMQESDSELDIELPRGERPKCIDWDGWMESMDQLKTMSMALTKKKASMYEVRERLKGVFSVPYLVAYVNELMERFCAGDKRLEAEGDVADDETFASAVVMLAMVIKGQAVMISKLLTSIHGKLEDPQSAQLLVEYGEKMVEEFRQGKACAEVLKGVKKQLRSFTKAEMDKALPKIQKSLWKDVSGNDIIKWRECVRNFENREGDTLRQAYQSFLCDDGTLQMEQFARWVYFNRGRFNNACVEQFLGYYFAEQYLQEQMAKVKPKKEVKVAVNLPEVLSSADAMVMWKKMQEMQWVDERFHPLISQKKAAILASVMADALDLSPRWTPFEQLWRIDDLASKLSQAMMCQYYSDAVKEYSKALE